MPQQGFEIVCALCSCRFVVDKLEGEDLLCSICGHSLDDDHSGSVVMIDQEAASS